MYVTQDDIEIPREPVTLELPLSLKTILTRDRYLIKAKHLVSSGRMYSNVVVIVVIYKLWNGLAPQYLGPFNYVADLPGRRPLRSAGTNRLPVPPVKLTTVANQPGFPGCRPMDMERSTR